MAEGSHKKCWITRKVIEAIIESAGGVVASGESKMFDSPVVRADTGNKLSKGQEPCITVSDEDEVIKVINN